MSKPELYELEASDRILWIDEMVTDMFSFTIEGIKMKMD